MLFAIATLESILDPCRYAYDASYTRIDHSTTSVAAYTRLWSLRIWKSTSVRQHSTSVRQHSTSVRQHSTSVRQHPTHVQSPLPRR
jgi:hypothetical protein